MSFKSVGALWVKEGNKGKYMSGNIEINGQKLPISVFKNDKTGDKKPDYRINVDEDKYNEFMSCIGETTGYKTPISGQDFVELDDDGDLPF